MEQFVRRQNLIEPVFRPEHRAVGRETFVEQTARERVRRQRLAGRCFHGQVAIHQQLTETEKPELDGIGVDAPAFPHRDHRLHGSDVVGRRPSLLDLQYRQIEPKIFAQALLQR